MDKKYYLWSLRFSTANGNHWKLEREVTLETYKEWLEVFKKDEPNVSFVVHHRKPLKSNLK